MGKQSFVKCPQIANLQILGLIRLSQIRKFFRYASPQIVNPQILLLIRKSQIQKFVQNTAQLKIVLKVVF